jgi:transmembrane sensor
LNTASSIEVDFTDERREVRLFQGQALFEVAKDARRPFVVSAGDRFVTALGTAFDVRIDAGRIDVVVIEGRVAVDPVKRTGLGRFIPALARQEVHPGEELTSFGDRPASVAAADVERITSWRRGQVTFRDDTIAAAVAEMNRYSPRPIIVTDPRVGNLRISGVFGLIRPENFVAAIVAHYPVDAQRDARDATVLSWRAVSAQQTHPPQE